MRPPIPSLHNRGERTITALTAFSDILQWSCFHSRDLNGLPLPPFKSRARKHVSMSTIRPDIIHSVSRILSGERVDGETRKLVAETRGISSVSKRFLQPLCGRDLWKKREKKERKRVREEREMLGWNNGLNFSSITLSSSQDGINDQWSMNYWSWSVWCSWIWFKRENSFRKTFHNRVFCSL